MKVTIDVPQEFVSEYKDDKFGDSLQRLKSDAHLLAGNYEKELVDMLIKAFKNANEDETPKLPTPPHPRWKPKSGDAYSTTHCVEYAAECHWMCDMLDEDYYSLGFVFKTKAEAEFDAERLKVLAEMREWAGSWDDEFSLRYDENNGIEVFCHVFSFKSYGEMRFATKEDAINCIKTVGEDRIKKYYFMIPETK